MSSSSTKNIERLIEQLEKERASFEEEACPLLSWQIDSFASCYDLLRENAESLEKRSKQRRSERLRARNFLVDVFLAIGPEVFLLCVFAAPISKLEKISSRDAIPKLRTWWKTTSNPHGLTVVATELCEAKSIRALISSCQKRKFSEISTDADNDQRSESNHSRRRHSEDEQMEANPERVTDPPNEPKNKIPSDDSNITTTQEQRVFENAPLGGIAKVFNEYMCNAIRRVAVNSDWKAAVTMDFPVWGGLVDCVMSLDVCERGVEQLAIALFNAEVKWVEQVLHVILKEGITLITSNSEEATLKGVPDEAIIKVFGPEIHDAITQCPMRRRELAEGKQVTECVSMILTKNGAIINLSLDLRGGLQIQDKLYT